MDGPLKELGKLETLTSGKSKGTTIQGSLDSLLKSLREAKDEIAANGVVDPSRLRDLSQVAEGKKKEIEDKQKEVYSTMSRFGKAWDKVSFRAFGCRVGIAEHGYRNSQRLCQVTLTFSPPHLLRLLWNEQ